MSACRYLFLVILSALSLSCAAAAHAEIEWRVVNRFPLFKNAQDFTELAAAWASGDSAAWAPGESAEAFLAKAVGSLNSQQARVRLKHLLPIDATLWNAEKGLYDRELFFYNKHRIQLKVQLPGQYCTWTVAGQTFPRTPCNDWFDPVGLEIEEEREFSISVRASGGDRLHRDGQKIATDLIIGLGDSFASGEGNPDHPAVWNQEGKSAILSGLSWPFERRLKDMLSEESKWWDLACHRSLLSWPALYAMNRAVSKPDHVVRFASFACTGAEIYDGFLRAQIIPKDRVEKAVERDSREEVIGVASSAERDGGWGSDAQREACQAAGESAFGTPTKPDCPMLRYSQLNALTLLLCDGETETAKGASEKSNFATGWNELYGPYRHLKCKGRLIPPTRVLLSFGGNDFAFAPVVKWGMLPSGVRQDILKPYRMIKREMLRDVARAVDPDTVRSIIEVQASQLYGDLHRGLTQNLGIPGERIYAMQYPDPLPTSGQGQQQTPGRDQECANRLRGGNEAQGQMVNYESGILHTLGFIKGITLAPDPPLMEKLRSFVKTLRDEQQKVLGGEGGLGWNIVDSQRAFDREGQRRMSICAVSAECETALDRCVEKVDKVCKEAEQPCRFDRYAVARGKWDRFQDALVYKGVTEWRPYDPARARGLNTGWDAALTQMRGPTNGSSTLYDRERLKSADTDWLSGSAHPTAIIHARIADLIDSAESEGKRRVSDNRSKPDIRRD